MPLLIYYQMKLFHFLITFSPPILLISSEPLAVLANSLLIGNLIPTLDLLTFKLVLNKKLSFIIFYYHNFFFVKQGRQNRSTVMILV